MRNYLLAGVFLIAALPCGAMAQDEAAPATADFKVTVTKVGGDGGWDYLTADGAARRLYIPRSGPTARITVYDLDTLKPAGTIPGVNAHGVAIDPKSGHGFTTSKPLVMFDTKTLAPIKTITVDGSPDGSLFDPFNQRVYIFSHSAPNVTVIDATNGAVLGTIDLGGMPEQGVSDGNGRIYVDLVDKDQVAVVDAKTMSVITRYDLDGVGAGPAGLALDTKNNVLFVACHNETMVFLNAADGKFVYALPIGAGVDGAAFDPKASEVYATAGDGTLSALKVTSPTNFQFDGTGTVFTPDGARTITLDPTTGKIYSVTAEFGPAPAPAANATGRPQRGPMVAGSFQILTVSK